jgi:hypothetical protein
MPKGSGFARARRLALSAAITGGGARVERELGRRCGAVDVDASHSVGRPVAAGGHDGL